MQITGHIFIHKCGIIKFRTKYVFPSPFSPFFSFSGNHTCSSFLRSTAITPSYSRFICPSLRWNNYTHSAVSASLSVRLLLCSDHFRLSVYLCNNVCMHVCLSFCLSFCLFVQWTLFFSASAVHRPCYTNQMSCPWPAQLNSRFAPQPRYRSRIRKRQEETLEWERKWGGRTRGW